MNTTAKWISENHYAVSNSKYLNVAVTDPILPEEECELNSLDLVLMGIASGVTVEMKKQLVSRNYDFCDISTDIQKAGMNHDKMVIYLDCKICSPLKNELLQDCLRIAIQTDFPGKFLLHPDLEVVSRVISVPASKVIHS